MRLLFSIVIVFVGAFHGCITGNREVVEHQAVIMIDDKLCAKPITTSDSSEDELSLGTLFLPKLAVSDLDVLRLPEIYAAIAHGSKNHFVRDYWLCRMEAEKIVTTPDEFNYLRTKLAFIAQNPSPEKLVQWERENPYASLLQRGDQFIEVSPLELTFSNFETIKELLIINKGEVGADISLRMPEGYYCAFIGLRLEAKERRTVSIVKTSGKNKLPTPELSTAFILPLGLKAIPVSLRYSG